MGRKLAVAGMAAVVVALIAGVVVSRADGADASEYLAERFTIRPVEGVVEGLMPVDLADALPNVRFRAPRGESNFTSEIIDGEIVEVSEGKGYWRRPTRDVDRHDAMTGTVEEIEFDDERAMWRYLEVHIAESGSTGEPRVLPWVLNGPSMATGERGPNPDPDDAELIAEGIRELGHVLVLLDTKPDLVRIDPGYVLTVDEDGKVSAPFREDGKGWVGRLDTKAKVKEQAAKPKREPEGLSRRVE